jgi:hypothetical protein
MSLIILRVVIKSDFFAPGIVTGWPRPGVAEREEGARGVTPSLFLAMAVD